MTIPSSSQAPLTRGPFETHFIPEPFLNTMCSALKIYQTDLKWSDEKVTEVCLSLFQEHKKNFPAQPVLQPSLLRPKRVRSPSPTPEAPSMPTETTTKRLRTTKTSIIPAQHLPQPDDDTIPVLIGPPLKCFDPTASFEASTLDHTPQVRCVQRALFNTPTPKLTPQTNTTIFKKAIFTEASDSLPLRILMSAKAITLFEPHHFARGAHAEAYFGTLVAVKPHKYKTLHYSPLTPQSIVIKMYAPNTNSITPLIHRVEEIERRFSRGGIDNFLYHPLTDQEDFQFSIHKRYTSTLSDTPFHSEPHPVQQMLYILAQVSYTLSQLHQHEGIHRDLKGDNILTDENGGALTDFEYMMSHRDSCKPHRIAGTPPYIDPRIFGSTPKESLLNQGSGKGIQTTASDCYAFGVTISIDVLLNFIIRKIQTSPLDETIKSKINTYISKIDPQIRPLEGDPIHHDDRISSAPFPLRLDVFKRGKKTLFTHPSTENLLKTLIHLCEILKKFDLCTVNEYTALKGLSKLACQLRSELPENRPTMAKAHAEILELQRQLVNHS